MKKILTTITLIAALAGCQNKPEEKKEEIFGETTIEDSLYKATLIDNNKDGKNDILKIERKFSSSYGSNEPRVRYFVTSMSRSSAGLEYLGIETNLVKPDFFDKYNHLLNPEIKSYRK